jgi:hypothetical protein
MNRGWPHHPARGGRRPWHLARRAAWPRHCGGAEPPREDVRRARFMCQFDVFPAKVLNSVFDSRWHYSCLWEGGSLGPCSAPNDRTTSRWTGSSRRRPVFTCAVRRDVVIPFILDGSPLTAALASGDSCVPAGAALGALRKAGAS